MLERTGEAVAARVVWARTRAERRKGLRAQPQLGDSDALVIARAPQVHTFGMRYAIDVVFCDRDNVVRHVVHAMRPGRVTRWVFGAGYAVELPAGAARGVERGDRFVFR